MRGGAVAAIDVGGTFTDIALWDETDGLRTHKLLTNSKNAAHGMKDGIDAMGVGVGAVVHGTTLVTNALIERRGATVGLITTDGHRDVLEIATELRYDTFDLGLRRPEPLVPRSRRLPIEERVGTDGTVVKRLDQEAVVEAARQLINDGVASIAVAFFNAWANPEHEQLATEALIRAFPGTPVSISSEVCNEIGEYERFSTTAANAFVKPLVASYLHELSEVIDGPLFLMLSDGTIAGVAEASRRPIKLLESGPAAGTIAAARLAATAEWPEVLAFDMGGTTAKLSLVHSGVAQLARSTEVARIHRFKKGSGLPITVPTVELIEIGAGGGSVAFADRLGLLHVGPRSAGAYPGPACYGNGGDEPTVTDADLHLGYLSKDGLAGGRLALETERADAALATLATNLETPTTDLALGVVDIVNTHMASAARVQLAEHGRDPRRYRLVAYGGAGPVHACGVADLLGIKVVVFPNDAGVASAVGMLQARRGVERTRTLNIRLDRPQWERIEFSLAELELDARELLAEAGVEMSAVQIELSADMRYLGQGHDVSVLLDQAAIGARDAEAIQKAFSTEYVRRFGRALDRVAVELVCLRLRASGPPILERPLRSASIVVGGELREPTTARRAYFRKPSGWIDVPVSDRDSVTSEPIGGPIFIDEANTTIVIPPTWRVSRDPHGNLVAEKGSN